MTGAGELEVRRLGPVGFAEALALQEDLVARRARDEVPDQLLLLEHPPTFTVGRGGAGASLPAGGPETLVRVSRGGDVTWHGPGQTVGYWIRKLEGRERDLHRHLRTIEETLIGALGTFGLEAGRREGLTGVWVGGKKVASIGVAVRSWIAYHGFALNRRVDPEIWGRFRPCGLDGRVMTDLASLLGRAPGREALEDELERRFRALDTGARS